MLIPFQYMLGDNLFTMFWDKFAYLVLQKLKKNITFSNNIDSLVSNKHFILEQKPNKCSICDIYYVHKMVPKF